MLLARKKSDLVRALQTVTGIVEGSHISPILFNVWIKRCGECLSFTATDIGMQVKQEQVDVGASEDFSLTVHAKKLLEITRTFNTESEIHFSLSEDLLEVVADQSRFTLQTLSADQFPALSFSSNEESDLEIHFQISQKNLKQLFKLVYFSMAVQDIRFFLNGTLLLVEDDKITALASDSHRLAYNQHILSESVTQESMGVLLPRKAVIELVRMLSNSDNMVEVSLNSQRASFCFEETTLITKLIDGDFPDYQSLLSCSGESFLKLDRKAALLALQRSFVLSSERLTCVSLKFSNESNSLQIFSKNTNQEETSSEIEVEIQGKLEDFLLPLNASYLLDVLSHLEGNSFNLSMESANSCIFISSEQAPLFKYYVMPLKV